jgi:hypothetical protein
VFHNLSFSKRKKNLGKEKLFEILPLPIIILAGFLAKPTFFSGVS